eukprot:76475-Amphidinium_carterae.1
MTEPCPCQPNRRRLRPQRCGHCVLLCHATLEIYPRDSGLTHCDPHRGSAAGVGCRYVREHGCWSTTT